jgi:putative membrane protein
MLTEILITILLGILAGIITGLIPGIHINLISALLVTSSTIILTHTSPTQAAIFIIAMSITHSFLDVIPSTFLGAPDASNALTALPAHRLLLKGKAYEAIRLTIIGSLGCLLLAIPISLLTYFGLQYYDLLAKNMFYILIIAILFMILKDKKRKLNASFFLLAGAIGIITLNLKSLQNPLFPLLSGLFGTSILITSLADKINIPKQTKIFEKLKLTEISKALAGGCAAGTLTSFLPGLGASQGAAIAQSVMKVSEKGFLITTGGINTINFTISLIAFFTIEKARNGSIIAIKHFVEIFTIQHVLLFMTIALITGAIATILCLNLTNVAAKIMPKIPYQKTIFAVIILILAMCIFLSGWLGLIVLITTTALGIIANKKDVAKNHLMGCLLLPTLIYFIPL